MDWARHRRRKAAAKCHVRLDLQSFLPRFAIVDTARHAGAKRAREVFAGIKAGEPRSWLTSWAPAPTPFVFSRLGLTRFIDLTSNGCVLFNRLIYLGLAALSCSIVVIPDGMEPTISCNLPGSIGRCKYGIN